MRKALLAVLLLLALALLVLYRGRPGPDGLSARSEPVGLTTRDGQGALASPDRNEQSGSSSPARRDRVAPWIKKGEKKRDPDLDGRQLAWLGEGWGLIDGGNYVTARKRFQELINEHPGEPAVPYAFLAIAEAYALEGGEANLRQACSQFRDFLIFYPNHPAVTLARVRLTELQELLPPEGTRIGNR
jgi:hypothetical protein